MRRRSFAYRVSALLSSVLLLQLSLLAGGRPCHVAVDHAMDTGAHAANGPSANARSVAHDQHTAKATAPSTSTPRGACDGMAPGTSCDAPWSAGGCSSASTCSAGAGMTSPAVVALETPTREAIHIAASTAVPLGPAFAPELPPPRA